MSKKKLFYTGIQYIFLVIVLIVMIAPFIWLIISSFRPNADLFNEPFSLPKTISIANYIAVFKRQPLLLYFGNTLAIAVITILITLTAAILASYALLHQFKLNKKTTMFLLIGLFIPTNAFMVPYYILINKFGLYDNILGVALVYSGINLPMSIMVIKSYMDSIPKELLEAAHIDGAGQRQTLIRIVLPISIPGIVTACVFIVINSWNELLFANLLNQSDKSRTIQVAIRSFLTTFEANYAYAFAAMVITMVPTIILYTLLTDRIVDGMTAGAVKG